MAWPDFLLKGDSLTIHNDAARLSLAAFATIAARREDFSQSASLASAQITACGLASLSPTNGHAPQRMPARLNQHERRNCDHFATTRKEIFSHLASYKS